MGYGSLEQPPRHGIQHDSNAAQSFLVLRQRIGQNSLETEMEAVVNHHHS
jgi:hypothetical protein